MRKLPRVVPCANALVFKMFYNLVTGCTLNSAPCILHVIPHYCSIIMYVYSYIPANSKICDMLNKNNLGLLKKAQSSKVESKVL